ncbi:hypothetical protein BKA70DRAFT_1414943, partial [Coprinopsis sp. MPI-PUGE-AT-0042]
MVSATIVSMIGDLLMIYRCFLIWNRNYWAISLPIVLAAFSSGFDISTIWFAHQVSFSRFLIRCRKS